MMMCGGSAADPFVLSAGNRDLQQVYPISGTHTPVDPRLVSGEKTFVIIAGGQSKITNSVITDSYVRSQAKNQHLNIFDGQVYRSDAPLMGCTTYQATYNYLVRLGDNLILNGYCARVIFVPIGIGGVPYDMFLTGYGADRIPVAVARCRALGLEPTHCIWDQGESDAIAGTSAAATTAKVRAIAAALHALCPTAPFIQALTTLHQAATTLTEGNVYAGQVAAASSALKIYNGPDFDTLGSSYRDAETQVHFNATGSETAAAMWSGVLANFA